MATTLDNTHGETFVKELSRREEREIRRREAIAYAEQAADARLERNRNPDERVKRIIARGKGANASDTMALMNAASPADLDFYILAEEYGPNRKSVLRFYGTPRVAARETFMRAVGLGSPDESPETGTTEE